MVMFLATLGVTVPSFVVATLIIYVFAGMLGWLPTFGLASPLGYIGPVVALSGYSLSFVARLTRSSMLEVLRQDYIRTARANGISERKVMFKHAMKNALIPVITYVGPDDRRHPHRVRSSSSASSRCPAWAGILWKALRTGITPPSWG